MSIMMQTSPPVKAGPWKERALCDKAAASVLSLAGEWAPTIPASVAFDGRLTALEVRVALAIAYHARNGSECWPSDETLARECHCTERSVRRAIKGLEAAGYVRINGKAKIRRQGGGTLSRLWQIGSEPEPMTTVESGHQRPQTKAKPTPPKSKLSADVDTSVRRCGHQRPHDVDKMAPRASEESHSEESKEETVTLRDGTVGSIDRDGKKPARNLRDSIKALPAEPDLAGSVARWIAKDLGDDKSVGTFKAKAKMVAAGDATPQRLLDAYDAGMSATKDSGIQRPGAFFMEAWKDWRPRASESEAKERDKDEADRKRYMEWPIYSLLAYTANQYNRSFELGADGEIKAAPNPHARPLEGVLLECLTARKPAILRHLEYEAKHRAEMSAKAIENLARRNGANAAPIGGPRA